jgi:predicted ferric reductase
LDALYLDEIESAHHDHPSFQPHIVDTSTDGQLTPKKTLGDTAPGSETWVYMCGPPAMMKAFSKDFRKRGIPAARVRWEQFNIR